MTAQDYGLARRMWHQLEPVHAVFWYAPQVFGEAAALGYEVKTRWPSYFAWRLAPLGAVGPLLAASACYSFSPAMVTAHVPAAWAVAPPPQILAAPTPTCPGPASRTWCSGTPSTCCASSAATATSPRCRWPG